MVVYEEPNKVSIEYDPVGKIYSLHWKSLNGPHYRKALDFLLAHLKKNGLKSLISDSSAAKDVQSQEDLAFVQGAVGQLSQYGARCYVAVVPASAIAKMGMKKVVQAMETTQLVRHTAPTYDEALTIARAA